MRITDTTRTLREKHTPDPIMKAEFPAEKKWQITVAGWFRQMGSWRCYHTWRSDRSEPGFPDLFCVHTTIGRRIWAELKTETGTVTETQEHWLLTLVDSGEEVYLWRPSDTDEIQSVLQETHNDAFSLRERGIVPTRAT